MLGLTLIQYDLILTSLHLQRLQIRLHSEVHNGSELWGVHYPIQYVVYEISLPRIWAIFCFEGLSHWVPTLKNQVIPRHVHSPHYTKIERHLGVKKKIIVSP